MSRRLRQMEKEQIIRQTLSRLPAAAVVAAVPAAQLDANGVILDVNVINDGEVLKRVGTTVVSVPIGAPGAHHTTHEFGGADQMTVAGLPGVLANPQPPIIGSGAAQAVAGNDARLTDTRVPTAHAVTHKSGGTDAIKLDELAAPTDILTLNADTSKHGLLPKLPGGSANFLRADGTWAAPTAALGLTTVECNLGAAPNARRSGHVQITGLSGLTPGKAVLVQQSAGPYTGKGVRADEAEMDMLRVTGKVFSATVIDLYWQAVNRVRGNFRFDYVVSA